MTVHRVVGNVIVEHTQISNGASIGYHFSETWQSTISAASVHWGKKKTSTIMPMGLYSVLSIPSIRHTPYGGKNLIDREPVFFPRKYQ